MSNARPNGRFTEQEVRGSLTLGNQLTRDGPGDRRTDGGGGADFRAVGLTDNGRNRSNNEDNFLIDHEHRLFMVADGVGGHLAGEIASSVALASIRRHIVDSMRDLTEPLNTPFGKAPEDDSRTALFAVEDIPEANMMAASINHASRTIFVQSQQKKASGRRAMGTTVAGVYLQKDDPRSALIFNVGDSRVYLFRNRNLVQVTTDQSAYQEWLSGGSKGPEPGRNVILQALGQAPEVNTDIRQEMLAQGDLILICTDGLSDYLDHETLTAYLSEANDGNLPRICQELIGAALARNGADNITLVLGKFG